MRDTLMPAFGTGLALIGGKHLNMFRPEVLATYWGHFVINNLLR